MEYTKDVAVLIQLYWIEQWSEFETYLSNIKKDYDLYVSIPYSLDNKATKDIVEKIKQFKSDAYVVIVRNRGMDIGACFKQMQYILNHGKKYKFYLKAHTKASIPSWRRQLLKPIFGSVDAVNKCIKILENGTAMIGSKKWLLPLRKHDICTENNMSIMKSYMPLFKYTGELYDLKFIGGTMFWVNGELWEDFFSHINIEKTYKNFCDGKTTDSVKGTHAHSMERLFGVYVGINKKSIVGL